MNLSFRQQSVILLGIFFIATGALIPSDWIVEYVRGPVSESLSPVMQKKLLLGAQLFKLGWAALGLALLVFPYLANVTHTDELKVQWDRFKDEKPKLPIITLLLMCGLILRLYGLDLGMWHDEIAATVNYVWMPVGELVTTYDSENQHFLYTLLAHASVASLGESVWATRLPAVGFGVGSLLGVYLVGRTLLSEREALFATAILVCSYHHIWFSQNARGYTGLMFFTMISSWAFLRGLGRNGLKWWVVYGITSALGMFTHLTMLFVITSHLVLWGMTAISHRDEGMKSLIGPLTGFSLAGLLTIQLHAMVLPQIFGTIGATTKVQAWNSLLWTILEFGRGMHLGNIWVMLIFIAMLAIFTWGMWRLFWDCRLLWALLILPAALGTMVVVGLGHPLWPRFFFFLSGFVILIAVRGMMLSGMVMAKVMRAPDSWGSVYGSLLCVGVICLFAVFVPGAYAPKQDYEGALKYVEQNRIPGDEVVTVGLAQFSYQRYFHTNWRTAGSLDELNAIRAHASRTWVVWTMPLHLEAYFPDILTSLKSDYAISEEFPGTLGQGTVYVYRQDRPSPPANAQSKSGERQVDL